MEIDLREIFTATMVLFAVIDIVGSIPIIIDLRQKVGHIHSEKASLVAAIMMIAFLFVGETILKLIGIDINSFAVAGSFVLFFLALEMILGIKLYRDEERGVIGGVCTGLGHYFGVDSFWFKLAFLILGFGTGMGFLAYLILWIAMPKAITTAEKLEMTGEPVTISNIEKKVREEFEQVSQRIQNADYNEIGEKVKSGAESFGNRLSGFITTVFGVFAKIIGAFVLIFASLSLLGVLIGSVILIFTSQLPQNAAINMVVTPIGLETPYWIQGL